MGRKKVKGVSWAAMILAGMPVAAAAQQQPAPRPPVGGAPTREELQRAPDAPPPSGGPSLSVTGGIPRSPCALADARFAGVTITLTGTEFTGLRGIDPSLLRPAYERFVGKPSPIPIVCDIRDDAEAILAKAGYIAALKVPAQKIDGGHVRFDVVLAHVVALRVRGDAGRNEGRIAAYLQPLQDAPAFNARDAERSLLLVSDLPGYQVRLALSPAENGQPGDVIGEVTVSHERYSVDLNIQNLGSESVGRFGGLLRAQFYGLTGMGDRTSIALFSTLQPREQQVVQVAHDLRVGSHGLALSGRFTYAWTRPTVPGLRLDADTLIGEVEASYPLVLKQSGTLRLAGGFDLINQDVDVGGVLLTRDRLRVLYARLDGDSIDRASLEGVGGFSPYLPRRHFAGTLELRQGVDVFDATKPCGPALARCIAPGAIVPSRAYGDPTAFVVRFAGTAEYRFTPKLTFALSPRAQYAPHALLSYEEYSGGSYTVGRGFDPGTVLGDSGAGASAEIRFGSTIPKSARAFAFEPYGFVDAAWAWNRDLDLRPFNPQRLVSAGVGVRAAYGNRGRIDALVAVPIDRSGPGGNRAGPVRFLVSLTTRLLPWKR